MYLKYGSYQHATNECAVVIERNATRLDSGVARESLERWSISGRLQAASQTAITTAIQALEAAYADNFKDIALYLDDGTVTAHQILNRNTIDGVFVVQPPSFPEGQGAEYSTFRNYTIIIEAKTTSSTSNQTSYTQSISYEGNGGPAWGWLVPLVGQPQQQAFTQRSIVIMRQSGTAKGWNTYPNAANPIYPQYLDNPTVAINLELPSSDSKERRVSWSYIMKLPVRPI